MQKRKWDPSRFRARGESNLLTLLNGLALERRGVLNTRVSVVQDERTGV